MHLPKPYLGMGTWGMGGKYERDPSNIEQSIEVLRYGLQLGLRLIDAAELYGEGLTEEIVGKAIKGHNREDLSLISKVWKTHLAYDDVLRAAEGSLKRLDTPYIDLYLIHYPNPEVPLQETLRAMERLVSDGTVKAIGVSNSSISDMGAVQALLTSTSLTANQIEYNLLHQEAGADTIPYCRTHDIDVIAYRPFAKGMLAQHPNTVLEELAKKYGKTPNQIALNWIISQGIFAIPKSSNLAHIEENAGALGWELSQEDIERLRVT